MDTLLAEDKPSCSYKTIWNMESVGLCKTRFLKHNKHPSKLQLHGMSNVF